MTTGGYTAAAPTLKRALSAFSSEPTPPYKAVRWLSLASTAAIRLWDDESWDVLSARHVQLARDVGALGVLPVALSQRAGVHLHQGDFAAAASAVEEARAIAEATGSELPPYASVALAAFRGRHFETSELIEASAGESARWGRGVGPILLQWANAVSFNALGEFESALVAAQRVSEDPLHTELVFSLWAAVELIEAAARSRGAWQAASALDRLSDSARASGSDWALGIEAYARAMLSKGDTAERLYREALDRLASTRVRVPLARAHLVYGEWLRGQNRRVDAREQLRTAHQMLSVMGAAGFAERAARELRAAGERVRKSSTVAPARLTAREAQIGQLAGDGLSNPQIAAQLFMSPRTVEYHLHKVFTKLDISSRSQLPGVLANH